MFCSGDGAGGAIGAIAQRLRTGWLSGQFQENHVKWPIVYFLEVADEILRFRIP